MRPIYTAVNDKAARAEFEGSRDGPWGSKCPTPSRPGRTRGSGSSLSWNHYPER